MINHMKRKSFYIGLSKCVVAVSSLLLLLVIASPSIPAAFKKVAMGEAPPAFSLRGLDGSEHSSGDLLPGKVTVIVFWATWSPRSLEVLADLTTLAGELEGESFHAVAINAEHPEITRGDQEKIKELTSGSAALILLDDGLKSFSEYGTMALPSILVCDKEGKVVFTMAGYPTTMRNDLPDAVKRALGLITEEEVAVVEEYVPKNRALMYYNLGKRLYNKGQEEKAEAQLLVSVERDPDFVKSHLLLGILYKKTGRLDEALKEFERVKELDPRDQEAGYQTAAITLSSKRFEEAEALFQELAVEFPEREELALGLALAHKYQGHDEEYEKNRKQAADLYPAEARYYYELGSVAEEAQDLEEAALLYRGAVEKAIKTRRYR
jgi:tetratricopeptide (TPR) repeat protein